MKSWQTYILSKTGADNSTSEELYTSTYILSKPKQSLWYSIVNIDSPLVVC